MIYFIIGFLGGILSSIVCLLVFPYIRYLRMRRIEEKAYEELIYIFPPLSGAKFSFNNRIFTASEIDSFVISNYAKIFEDEQRSHNEEIVDSVRADASSGREIHFRNTSDEVVEFDNFRYEMRANPDCAKVFEDYQRSNVDLSEDKQS